MAKEKNFSIDFWPSILAGGIVAILIQFWAWKVEGVFNQEKQ